MKDPAVPNNNEKRNKKTNTNSKLGNSDTSTSGTKSKTSKRSEENVKIGTPVQVGQFNGPKMKALNFGVREHCSLGVSGTASSLPNNTTEIARSEPRSNFVSGRNPAPPTSEVSGLPNEGRHVIVTSPLPPVEAMEQLKVPNRVNSSFPSEFSFARQISGASRPSEDDRYPVGQDGATHQCDMDTDGDATWQTVPSGKRKRMAGTPSPRDRVLDHRGDGCSSVDSAFVCAEGCSVFTIIACGTLPPCVGGVRPGRFSLMHSEGATLQRLMNKVLGAELEPHTFAYFDDFVVEISTFDEHLVFGRPRSAGLKINIAKSRLKFLGYIVSHGVLDMDPNKVAAIVEVTHPTNGKNKRFCWQSEQEASFLKLKECLVTSQILSCPQTYSPQSAIIALRSESVTPYCFRWTSLTLTWRATTSP
ncbi:hypothetical protein J437_LFUL017007 [Ladona fulva]|uniref:Uncharacterized protein n=1 Tax=Ladona fulva TaxID=123851 RepID=A0A8K0KLQ0_LADFU|nr:hypothetical protein J437_LFUL017007 [Ladona fulva]